MIDSSITNPTRSQSFVSSVTDNRTLEQMIGDLELNLYNRQQQILQNSAETEKLKNLRVVLERDRDLLELGITGVTYTDVYDTNE